MASVPRDKRLPLSETNLRGILVSPAPASAFAVVRVLFLFFVRGLLGAPQVGAVPGGGTEYLLGLRRGLFLPWLKFARSPLASLLLTSRVRSTLQLLSLRSNH